MDMCVKLGRDAEVVMVLGGGPTRCLVRDGIARLIALCQSWA